MFLAEAPKLVAKIDAAKSSGEAAEMRRAAHMLKNSAHVIGALALPETALCIQEFAHDGDIETAEPARRQLEDDLARLRPMLQRAIH